MNKLQWYLERNSYFFVQENEFENVVCEMAAILSQPQCVEMLNVFLAIFEGQQVHVPLDPVNTEEGKIPA